MVKTLPCVAVFMSSLTIVVIALDRYLVICRPAHRQVPTAHREKGWESAGQDKEKLDKIKKDKYKRAGQDKTGQGTTRQDTEV